MTTEGTTGYKTCPMCAEHIQPDALVCRYCGYDYRTNTAGGTTSFTVSVDNPRYNGLAIASMVLGILWIWWIGSILAIVFGFVALNQIKNSDGAQTGRGMAIAGLVLGFIGLGTILFFFVIAAVGSSVSTEFDTIGSELGTIVTPLLT
jgi:hypothetical protein